MKMELTSTRVALRVCALSAALSLIASAATAQTEREKGPPRAKDAPAATPRAAVAVAPNARLTALVQAGGTVIRSKGVQGVARVDTGTYCIRPTAASGVNPANSIVVVSPEFFFSDINEVMVQWAARGSPCGNDRIAVYTLDDFNLDARYTFSNRVGFSIYVP
jgi:hypothetical protein